MEKLGDCNCLSSSFKRTVDDLLRDAIAEDNVVIYGLKEKGRESYPEFAFIKDDIKHHESIQEALKNISTCK